MSFGFRGLVGAALGDPDATRDPFGLGLYPSLAWRGPVPPIPQRAPLAQAAETRLQTPAADAKPPQRKAGKRDELQVAEGRGTWRDEDAKRREKALAGWEELLSSDPSLTELGRQLADAEDGKEAADTLRYSFAEKATATLEKRLTSLRLYGRWAAASGIQGALPKSEGDVYKYVRALEEAGAPPTRAQSFVEATRFAFGVAGAEPMIKALLSSRVLGATLASSSRKRLLLQCAPLSVKALALLEHLVLTSSSSRQAVMAGNFLFLAHTRARYSDLVRVQKEPRLDIAGGQGYVETFASSEHTKTGRAKKKRRREVPVVGLAFGLLGGPWAQTWLEARSKEGLDAATDGTLFPARSKDGWSKASTDVTEAGVVLRTLLETAGLSAEEAKSYSTHSCKATMLSWCAKAGVRSEHRRLLGGHSRPKERMVLEYSRDSLASPLLSLSSVLAQIRGGEFDPDADRSGRMGAFGPLHVRLSLQCDFAAPAAVEPKPASDLEPSDRESASSAEEDEEPSSDSSEESCSEVPAAEPEAQNKHDFTAGRVLFVHPRYNTLHAAKAGDESGSDPRLVCGVAKERCRFVEDVVSADFQRLCDRCFAR